MFFLFLILIFIVAILTTNIKIEMQNFLFKFDKKIIKYNFTIKIIFFIFGIIPIFYLKLNKKKIKNIIIKIKKKRFNKKVEKNKYKIIKDHKKNKKIDANFIKTFYSNPQQNINPKQNKKLKSIIDTKQIIDNLKIELIKANLQINVGTENAAITSFTVPIISSIASTIYSYFIKEYTAKHKFKITPIYNNQNLINVNFSGIIYIKMIHIISTICMLIKKRKGDKNVRTSNTRSYDYNYE